MQPLTWWRIGGLLTATVVALIVLGRYDGCATATEAFTGGGATIRMQPIRMSRVECDVDLGESLLRSLASVELPPNRRQVLFIGNSQQYTASLPRGARPEVDREGEMASSLVARSLARTFSDGLQVYTAAAPNQNFVESLWQGIYWFEVSRAKPSLLVLQASFDTFRKTGIRPGFTSLLDDDSFRASMSAFRQTNPARAWSSDFDEGFKTHSTLAAASETETDKSSTVESRLRGLLEGVPLFAAREKRRSSFLTALYLARVHLLRISPTTKRHITGQPLEQNLQALLDLVAIARQHDCEVLVYNAPTNPAVSMFYEDEYDRYLKRLAEEVTGAGAHFVDLRNVVESPNWGYWIDGPDPIHFDERGHEQLAENLTPEIEKLLVR